MEMQDIIAKAWEDEAFKQALLDNPRKTIEEALGIEMPAGVEIFIHEQTPTALHLILPMKPESR